MTSPAQMAGYEPDGLGYKSFRPDLVVVPSDADELARVVRVLHDVRVPICLRGAGTSLSGGPVAAQVGAQEIPGAFFISISGRWEVWLFEVSKLAG